MPRKRKATPMSKSERNKSKKRKAILNSAYKLFSTQGFSNTPINDIARKAGIGKGTFYLYFSSKEELRDELIMIKASKILTDTVSAFKKLPEEEQNKMTFADSIVFFSDYIIDVFAADHDLLRFINKYLNWGMFFSSNHSDNDDVVDFQAFVIDAMKVKHLRVDRPEALIYTLLDLVNSTCYNVILEEKPMTVEEYKPYIAHILRLIISDQVSDNGTDDNTESEAD